MEKIVNVELLKAGDRIEFITRRSEWDDNCFLSHPVGVVVVAKNAFLDSYQQCRFGWRHEKFPNGKPQDWWGRPQTEVRLLRPLPAVTAAPIKPARPAKAKH